MSDLLVIVHQLTPNCKKSRRGNTSELGRRSLEEGEAGLEGILALGVPGLEEGGQI